MTIYKQFVGEKEIKEETTEDFLRRTEEAGYWKQGTALQTLEETGTLHTPFARYATSKEQLG